jgi:hypothetical protein
MSEDELVQHLQSWHESRNKAIRRNRNLLQYAAGVAALLGISAGSGGIFALADAVNVNGSEVGILNAVLILVIVASIGLAAVLMVLLVQAFFGRLRSEAEADRHLRQLIELKPDLFWTRPGD